MVIAITPVTSSVSCKERPRCGGGCRPDSPSTIVLIMPKSGHVREVLAMEVLPPYGSVTCYDLSKGAG